MPKSTFNEIKDLNTLKEIMAAKGAVKLYVKRLSPNDNSKNQVYLGPGFTALNIIPSKEVYVDEGRIGSKRDRFKADISLQWKLSTDLPGVRLDREQIQSVLENLVANAVNAMPDGGQITIVTSLVRDLLLPASSR